MTLACAVNDDNSIYPFDEKELLKCAQILLNCKVDINSKEDELNATALHFAIKNDHRSLVKFLLDKGADVDALDNEKRTVRKYNMDYE